ncbi:MAG: fibronectin type III domain-containing protein [Candidatus Rifleibacteriota bacterium]
MCPGNKLRLILLILLPSLLIVFIQGCGLRQSQTGSLSSRIIDADGDAVVDAEVFSIFRESEKVYTAKDGGFHLSELPAGLNNIVILHPDYRLEERQIEIRSDETTALDFIRLDQANAPNRISNVRVVSVASTSAKISWLTYREVVCNIDYGTSRNYGSIYREARPAKEHEAIITGLTPETFYHFRVQYISNEGASYYSYDYSFETDLGNKPAPPVGISLKPISEANTVEVVWQPATATSVVGYNLYRRENGGDWLRLNETPLSDHLTSYKDTGATAGMFTDYAVTAVNQFTGESYKLVSEKVFVPGILNTNISIAQLESPIILNSDLIVPAGINLEVEPGVEFLIGEKDLAASGLDEDRVEIIVSGRLIMNGTELAPVKFRPLDGSGRRDHWAGIKILSSDTGISTLSHVEISGCYPYSLNIEASRIDLDSISVAYSQGGIRLAGVREILDFKNYIAAEIDTMALKIEGCRKVIVSQAEFQQVDKGIEVAAAAVDEKLLLDNTDIYCQSYGIKGVLGQSVIKNVLIVSEKGTGISVNSTLHSSGNNVDHCTIDADNGIELASGTVVISNNIIVNRNKAGKKGIVNSSILTPSYDFNNLWGYATAYEGCGPGIGAIKADPYFVGGNPFDYHLRSDSSLNLQDENGSEMGRYGVSEL